MNLPKPPDKYDPGSEVRRNTELEQADRENLKNNRDLQITTKIVLSGGGQVVLASPDGSQFYLTGADDGTLTATAL